MATRQPIHFICLILLVYLLYLPKTCQGKCQERGWFGTNCQYRCNCKGEKCGQDGQCVNTTCEVGWFGVTCQYQNLLSETTAGPSNSKPHWLTDDDDRTCNDGMTENLFLEFKHEYPFTWLRLVLNDTANLAQLNIMFTRNNKTSVPCIKPSLYVMNRTADFRCKELIFAQYINITGNVLFNVCSLYISGGRNVALKEKTTQSTTYNNISTHFTQSSNAVDGNTNGYFNYKSCTLSENESQPHWLITFSNNWIVNRMVVFNRRDLYPERLQNFILQLFNEENTMIAKYQDNVSQPQNIYTVINTKITPIHRVQITATKKDSTYRNQILLTICEFEAYADCEEGKWGLSCQQACSNDCTQSCHPDDGSCETKCVLDTDHPDCVQKEKIRLNYGSDNQFISEHSSQGISNERSFELGLANGVVAMIISIIICAIFYIRQRRRKAKSLRQRKDHVYNEPTQLQDDNSLYTRFNSNVLIIETSELMNNNKHQNKENMYNVIKENV